MTVSKSRVARRQIHDHDRGVALVLFAFAMVVLMMLAAFAIDLAAVRNDRTSTKRASDAAAAAGALAFVDDDAEAGCLTAVDYLALNGVTITPDVPIDCTVFPATCTDGITPSVSASMSDSAGTVTITYPVEDSVELMNPSAVGTTVQTIVDDDGTSCDRFGVSITSTRNTFFAGILDANTLTTTMHSVTLMTPSVTDGRALNLLLLERHDCDTLTASGAGSGGGIAVRPMTDPITGQVHPGTIILDSDGTGSSCGSEGTVDVVGSGAVIRADGEPGCAGELSPGTGRGCGFMELFAPGSPGCNLPACTSTGTVAPSPDRSRKRLTRAPVDWIFNCKGLYPAALDIPGCPYALSTDSYIDDLVDAVGTSGKPALASDWQNYAPTYPCSVGGPPSTVVTIPEGNWRVNCDLSILRKLVFSGGNVVFDGDVSIGSSGVLDINSSNTTSTYGPGDTALDTRESSATAAFVYFRDGTLTKSAQGSLILTNVMTYMSDTSTISLGGGSGPVKILAPTAGPFKNLAMWSESSIDHNFAGQASLELEGVFFTPVARITYQGNGSQVQVAAQFVALKLSVGGNGRLDVQPRFDRLVAFPQESLVNMIR